MSKIALFIAALALSTFANASSFGPPPPNESFTGIDGTRYEIAVWSFVGDRLGTVGAVTVNASNGNYSATFRVIVQGDHCRAGGGVAIVDTGDALVSRAWGSGVEPLDLVAGIVCANLIP